VVCVRVAADLGGLHWAVLGAGIAAGGAGGRTGYGSP
jgi:hypothetical protein